MNKSEKPSNEVTNDEFGNHSSKIETIDQYILMQDKALHSLLYSLRETIKRVAPLSIEKISWGMPTFYQKENIIHFAAFKKHLGIYPGDISSIPFMDRLASLKHGKGSIQFPYEKIDFELIEDITKWRLSQIKK